MRMRELPLPISSVTGLESAGFRPLCHLMVRSRLGRKIIKSVVAAGLQALEVDMVRSFSGTAQAMRANLFASATPAPRRVLGTIV